jgi:hypothetical protein
MIDNENRPVGLIIRSLLLLLLKNKKTTPYRPVGPIGRKIKKHLLKWKKLK